MDDPLLSCFDLEQQAFYPAILAMGSQLRDSYEALR